MMTPKDPVSVRGVSYPSQTAAAKAFKVGQGHIHRMAKSGTLDNLGLGTNFKVKFPVEVDGEPFESQADAARHIGIRPEHLNTKIRRLRKQGITKTTVRGRLITWKDPK